METGERITKGGFMGCYYGEDDKKFDILIKKNKEYSHRCLNSITKRWDKENLTEDLNNY